jgi:cysteine synthase
LQNLVGVDKQAGGERGCPLIAKLESFNPCGSVKDRIGFSSLKILLYSPAENPVRAKSGGPARKLFLPSIKEENVDEMAEVSSEDAISRSRRLAKEEGILGGMSIGANLSAGLVVEKRAGGGKVVLVQPATAENRTLESTTTAIFLILLPYTGSDRSKK